MYKQLVFIGLFGFSSLYAKGNAIPSEEIKNFVDVYNAIRREYVEETTPSELIDNAIEGMLSGLDPHSVYLKKSDAENFYRDTNGHYPGVGIEVEMIEGQLKIIAPITGSPAEKAGIQANDTIVKIDDKLVNGLQIDEVIRLLRGEAGEAVKFVIQRDSGKTENITVVRELINIPSVAEKVLSPGFAVIRVNQFQENTANEFSQSLNKLNANDELKGLIIDLRNNPGGFIAEATGIADLFLSSGLIVSTKNNNTGEEERIRATVKSDAINTPLVVLINGGSASASELLAGALQDHKRAIIAGQKSFGKGSVQDVLPLSNGDAIKMTIAQYYTPDGHAIQARGVVPDIEIAAISIKENKVDLLSYSEDDIVGHLPNPEDESGATIIEEGLNDSESKALNLAKQDFQLYEALNILKTLTFREQL